MKRRLFTFQVFLSPHSVIKRPQCF
jgi:hypothetical protein